MPKNYAYYRLDTSGFPKFGESKVQDLKKYYDNTFFSKMTVVDEDPAIMVTRQQSPLKMPVTMACHIIAARTWKTSDTSYTCSEFEI